MNYFNRNGFDNDRNGFGRPGQYGQPQPQQGQQSKYKDMQGKAWRNMKATKPNSPHFTGAIQVAGVEYYVSIWLGSHPQRGDEISIKINPKQEQRRQQFQNGPTYTGFQHQSAPQPNAYSFVPSGRPQEPYNAGPPQNYSQPNYGQPHAPHQPAGNGAPPPANGPEDFGMPGYETREDDFPGF